MIWQVGDLAIRVRDPFCFERRPDQCAPIYSALMPGIGTVWIVEKVELHDPLEWGSDEVGTLIYLGLQGQPSTIVFDARLFERIDRQHLQQDRCVTIEPELEFA